MPPRITNIVCPTCKIPVQEVGLCHECKVLKFPSFPDKKPASEGPWICGFCETLNKESAGCCEVCNADKIHFGEPKKQMIIKPVTSELNLNPSWQVPGTLKYKFPESASRKPERSRDREPAKPRRRKKINIFTISVVALVFSSLHLGFSKETGYFMFGFVFLMMLISAFRGSRSETRGGRKGIYRTPGEPDKLVEKEEGKGIVPVSDIMINADASRLFSVDEQGRIVSRDLGSGRLDTVYYVRENRIHRSLFCEQGLLQVEAGTVKHFDLMGRFRSVMEGPGFMHPDSLRVSSRSEFMAISGLSDIYIYRIKSHAESLANLYIKNCTAHSFGEEASSFYAGNSIGELLQYNLLEMKEKRLFSGGRAAVRHIAEDSANQQVFWADMVGNVFRGSFSGEVEEFCYIGNTIEGIFLNKEDELLLVLDSGGDLHLFDQNSAVPIRKIKTHFSGIRKSVMDSRCSCLAVLTEDDQISVFELRAQSKLRMSS